MPIHDWTRVDAGIFHDFDMTWLVYPHDAIKRVLPAGYTAMTEQRVLDYEVDILAMNRARPPEANGSGNDATKSAEAIEDGISVATAPPRVMFSRVVPASKIEYRHRSIVVRHVTGRRLIAVVEILSPGNKSGYDALRAFTAKITEFLDLGIHVLVVDLFPPTSRDPNGIHGAIWADRAGDFSLSPQKPLTLVSYVGGEPERAYIQPVAVGSELPEMPLFLTTERYVNAPLNSSYQEAFVTVDDEWQEILTSPLK